MAPAEGGRARENPRTRIQKPEGLGTGRLRARMHANSTVGQLAEQAKVSHHKAAQTMKSPTYGQKPQQQQQPQRG